MNFNQNAKIIQLAVIQILLVIWHTTTAQTYEVKTEVLSDSEKSIIQISSYTAQGEVIKLKEALYVGLENNLTVNQIKEVLVHIYAYAGFPRSIRGLQTFLEVLNERKTKGILEVWGPEASAINTTIPKYDRGVANLEELIGIPLNGKSDYQEFSPEIDRFLKEHLFADIFERDVITYKQRELVTISVIASLGTLDPMLKTHYGLSLNVGWQPEQLIEFTDIIRITSGDDKFKSAHDLLIQVLNSRN